MLDAKRWPVGIVVKRWYEAVGPRVQSDASKFLATHTASNKATGSQEARAPLKLNTTTAGVTAAKDVRSASTIGQLLSNATSEESMQTKSQNVVTLTAETASNSTNFSTVTSEAPSAEEMSS